MDWLKSIGIWVKNLFTLISRVMRLEERVSALEKKTEAIQTPPKDVRENLIYDKELNYYTDKNTGERFCPVCLGNGKKVTINWSTESLGEEGWNCDCCKASKWKNPRSPLRFIE